MQLNKKLNLVLPLYRGKDQASVYVHSTPISRAVFEAFFMIIAKTFSSIYAGGLGVTGGPAVAAMLLRQHAKEQGGDEYLAEVDAGLFSEIRRLTNVVVLGPDGWETVPLDEGLKRKLVDEDEAGEVENALAFFTVVSCMHRRGQLTGVLGVACDLWGARIVYSNCTEFAASLPTSITADDTGTKE